MQRHILPRESSGAFEILNRAFMFLRRCATVEGPEIFALLGFGVDLARVETVFA